jgi:hypothetical protein
MPTVLVEPTPLSKVTSLHHEYPVTCTLVSLFDSALQHYGKTSRVATQSSLLPPFLKSDLQ